ncbi:MAG: porphobilinogen synthase [Gammaproteobacteria bacterium]|nr:porphobilinogen synthase [Gammaproteobacteria bacterium]
MSANFPQSRMRRLRSHPRIQDLIRETELQVNDLIFPLFIHHGEGIKNPISSMPGIFQISNDYLAAEIAEIESLGIPGVILFGIPEEKDPEGLCSLDSQGLIQTAIRTIKNVAPQLLVISDLCLCEYTDHGHCGVVSDRTGPLDVDNDLTLDILVKQAISHAEAGADIIAPSGMIDGMVQAIRKALDQAGYEYLPILSYAIKYCSSLYGPFREAAQGAPQFGNRRTYQMDPANGREALREASLDLHEGADMLMVKPAHAYLDVIWQVKQKFPEVPLGAYHVSGEYAMIKAAAQNKWLDEKKVALEILTGIKRAGADFIITYFAKEMAYWLKK